MTALLEPRLGNGVMVTNTVKKAAAALASPEMAAFQMATMTVRRFSSARLLARFTRIDLRNKNPGLLPGLSTTAGVRPANSDPLSFICTF